MGVIVVAVLGLAIFNGGFSFSPSRPTGGTAPTADVQGGFQTAGRVTGFDVVVPKGIPAAWHPSSFSVTAAPGTAAAPPTARGGWLVPSGAFITLIESSGSPAAVLQADVDQTSGLTTGSVVAGGANWTIGPGVREETAWWRTQTGVTLLITGNASSDEFNTLAEAVAG